MVIDRHPAVFFTGGLGLVLKPMADTVAGGVAQMPAETLVMVDVNCRPNVIGDRAAYVARLDRVLARTDIVKASDDDLAYLFRPSLRPRPPANWSAGVPQRCS